MVKKKNKSRKSKNSGKKFLGVGVAAALLVVIVFSFWFFPKLGLQAGVYDISLNEGNYEDSDGKTVMNIDQSEDGVTRIKITSKGNGEEVGEVEFTGLTGSSITGGVVQDYSEKKGVFSFLGFGEEKKAFLTGVVGFENTEDFEFEKAGIKLKKEGNIDYVARCEEFDFSTGDCNEWINSGIEFEDEGDYISFEVDSFSAYAGIIEITDAMRLNSEREFIDNVFEEVSVRDGVEARITEGDYVRVTFEEELDSKKDITFYAWGDGVVEVYEKNSDVLLATFPRVGRNPYDEQEYKIYLTELNGKQDTFDLYVREGFVKFDLIIDPTIVIGDVGFRNPTPEDGASIEIDSQDMNVSIQVLNTGYGYGLKNVTWLWNGTEYVVYDGTTVLHLDFDNVASLGESTDVAVDISWYGNNATLNGAVWSSDGRYGSALSFAGADEHVVLPSTLLNGLSSGTISFWFKANSDGNSTDTLFAYGGQDGAEYLIIYDDETSVTVYRNDEGLSNANNNSGGGSATEGEWNHVAVTWDDSNFKSYLNGNLFGTMPGNFNPETSQTTMLGDSNNRDYFFNGLIDELDVYSRALTADEINQSYRYNFKRVNQTNYEFYVNETDLVLGETYDYILTACDVNDGCNDTGTRSLTYFVGQESCWDAGADPRPICNCEDLRDISTGLSSNYELQNDIDCSGTVDWNSGAGFDPAGTFTGVLNGGGYSISDLYINRPGEDLVGLFDGLNGGIYNLDLNSFNVTSRAAVGMLAGRSSVDGDIENVSFSGNVEGTTWIGGLVGQIYSGVLNVKNVSSSSISVGGTNYIGSVIGGDHNGHVIINEANISNAVISGTGTNGGVVGWTKNSGNSFVDVNVYNVSIDSSGDSVGGFIGSADLTSIENCSIEGGNVSGAGNVGGFVGLFDDSSIINSFSTVDVTGTGGNVGGFIGIAQASSSYSINSSYCTGDVSAGGIFSGGFLGYGSSNGLTYSSYATGNVVSTSNFVGGFVGHLRYGTQTIDSCYSTGNVHGGDTVGGFAGIINSDGTQIINNSFSSGNVTGTSNLAGFVGENRDVFDNAYWYNSSGNPGVCVSTNSGTMVSCTAKTDVTYFQGDVDSSEPFSSWEFFDVWEERENDYPSLTWQGIGGDIASLDTCSCPSSGDWVVNAADNCVIISDCSLPENTLTIYGTGSFTVMANVTVDRIVKSNDARLIKPANDGNRIVVK